MEHAAWVDEAARPPITYGAWSVPAADVKRIVEGVALVLVPLVNPDGRDFSFAGTDELHYMWRKNRRPPAAGHTGPWCAGVDLNRNFDIAWDFERYYNPAAAEEVQSSKDACDPQIYIGPEAASEPETRNVQSVVTQMRPSHFMDVHSYSRAILFPWGMDDDQGREPTQSFQNPDWDRSGPHRGRDGLGGVYGEYLPSEVAAGHAAIGRRMRDAIRDQAGPEPTARRRSMYTVKQALGLYPTTGTSDDYCAALAMLDARTRAPTPSAWNAGSTRRPTTRTTTRADSTPTTARSSRRSNARSMPRSWRSRRRRWNRGDRGHRRRSSSTVRTLVAGRPSSVSSAGSVTANSPRRAARNMPSMKSATAGGSPPAALNSSSSTTTRVTARPLMSPSVAATAARSSVAGAVSGGVTPSSFPVLGQRDRGGLGEVLVRGPGERPVLRGGEPAGLERSADEPLQRARVEAVAQRRERHVLGQEVLVRGRVDELRREQRVRRGRLMAGVEDRARAPAARAASIAARLAAKAPSPRIEADTTSTCSAPSKACGERARVGEVARADPDAALGEARRLADITDADADRVGGDAFEQPVDDL